jgi:membrane-bound serine protease (ClpP class)
MLLTTGALGIYTEFLRPGTIIPGVCGSVLLLFGLAGFLRSGFSHHWLGAAVLLLGLALCLPEAKYGGRHVLTALGATIMPLGATMLEPRLHLITAVLTLVPFGLITSFLVAMAVRARRNKAI